MCIRDRVVRTQDTGFFFAKDNPNKLTYEIFPSLAVEMDYFAKNIGTEDNEFQFTPSLVAQGKDYMGAAFTITVQVLVNGVEDNDEFYFSSNVRVLPSFPALYQNYDFLCF